VLDIVGCKIYLIFQTYLVVESILLT
jgi:hypothetical protein